MSNNKWNIIKDRLNTVQLSLEKGFEPNPEEKANILRKRAERLAKETKNIKEGAYCEVVEFLLAHERYSIELKYIREVYPLKEFTPIPCTPSFVLGIINFRGQILSIIDLKKFFELPDVDTMNLRRVIVLRSDNMEFGILADIVIGVKIISLSDIQPTLSTLTGIRSEYMKGITKDRLVILNGEKILSDKNLIVYQEL